MQTTSFKTEPFTLDKDIRVLYVAASSFPAGIKDAFDRLGAIVPFSPSRKLFGISRPENGNIVYRAAAEEIEPGDAEKFKLDTLVLKKGNYISITIPDFMNDIPAIGRAFEQLLLRDDLDPQGYCVEWYYTEKDVKCMIRLG